MLIKQSFLFLILSISTVIFAQNNEVLATINGEKLYKEDFLNTFEPDNTSNQNIKNDSISKYLNQFIEFKLKVLEAKSQGINKSKKFVDEVDAYSKQLLKRYLVDANEMEYLVNQTYERSKTEVRIKQILIRLDINALAKDSAFAYQKAMNIRKRLLNGGDFGLIAAHVSDDPSASVNGGDMWYVKPLMVPYAVENYIYGNLTEKISMPIRSENGYHLIEIIDKRPSVGRYKVSHILLSFPSNDIEKAEPLIKQKIDSIYQKLIDGENFELLAIKYSSDKGTSEAASELPWFESGKMPREFEEAVINLKSDGAISKPLKTKYGWHIIKRISHLDNPSFEQIKEQLYNLVIESEKGKIAENKQINKLKNIYHFTNFNSLSTIYTIIDSTIFTAEWKIPFEVDLGKNLFSIDNQNFTQNDFAKFIETDQKEIFPIPLSNFIDSKYKEFISKVIVDIESNKIQKNNIEFIRKMDNFKDNLLANFIFGKEVIEKASNDKEQLNFYLTNKSNYNKLYNADVCIYSYSIDKPGKIQKQIDKINNPSLSGTELEKSIQANIDNGFILSRCFKGNEGEDKLVDECINQFKRGALKNEQRIIIFEDKKIIVWLKSEIKKSEKPFEEIKDIVVEDYQSFIEKNWLQELKKKNTVVIDQKVLESLKK